MQRDFVFFVSGVPDEMLIHGANDYFFAPVRDDIRNGVAKLAQQFGDLQHWLRKTKGEFSFAAFRNDFHEEREAFEDAYERLSGILDGYSFLTEDAAPEVWPLVQIREEKHSDVIIKFFARCGWARLNSKDGKAEELWAKRTSELLQRFLKFFDAMATNDPKLQTELINQLRLSAKMYRHGQMASAFGINFLCKFTALEGLVCGSALYGKERLLRERLTALFRHNKNLDEEVSVLWRLRCEASHQGRAFSNNFVRAIGSVECLALGTMTFALAYVETVATIDELWGKVTGYTLPPEVIMERPPEIMRAAVQLFGETPVGAWVGIGRLIDHCFEHLE